MHYKQAGCYTAGVPVERTAAEAPAERTAAEAAAPAEHTAAEAAAPAVCTAAEAPVYSRHKHRVRRRRWVPLCMPGDPGWRIGLRVPAELVRQMLSFRNFRKKQIRREFPHRNFYKTFCVPPFINLDSAVPRAAFYYYNKSTITV